jgi:hypothetical protein
MNEVDTRLSVTTRDLKAIKDIGDVLQGVSSAREQVVDLVKRQLAALAVDDPLMQLWANSAWLQEANISLPGNQFERPIGVEGLVAAVQEAWSMEKQAATEYNNAEMMVPQAEDGAVAADSAVHPASVEESAHRPTASRLGTQGRDPLGPHGVLEDA